MIWKRLKQPVTLRSALGAVGGILLAAGMLLGIRQGYRWLTSGSPSPRQIKAAIRTYLQQKVPRGSFKADYDFNLKQTVIGMQTNALRLRQTLAAGQTNLANLRKEIVARRGELTKLQEEERTLKYKVRETETDLAEKQRRLTRCQQELSLAQTNAFRAETNLLALKQSAAGLQATCMQLTDELTVLHLVVTNLFEQAAAGQTNLVSLQKEVAAAQKAIAAKQQETSSLRSKLKEQLADVAAREARLESARTSVATAQTNVVTAQTNVAALREGREEKQKALATKQEEVAAKDATLNTQQKEMAARQADLEAKQKDLVILQRELAAKEQLLANQLAVFSRELRKQAAEATSYETLYLCIGQQLWLADKFLLSQETNAPRSALPLAREAAECALHQADDAWLAARICEGYLWPHLELADSPDRPRQNADSLLQVCQNVFQRAEEPPNAIRNFRLRLQYVTNERQRESVRYSLAHALEQAGELQEAASWYRQVTDTNYAPHAERRLAAIEQQLQRKPASAQ